MKTLTTILTALFLFTLTSFGQSNVVDGVSFYLYNETPNTDLSVAHDENENVFILSFDYPVNITTVDATGVIEVLNLTEKTIGDEGAYSLIIKYDDTFGGYVNGNVAINYISFDVPEFTANDTLFSYNNGVDVGVASVDTVPFFNNGFTDGVASIDSSVIWNIGYDAGVVEGENTANEDAYNAGYANGETGTGVNDFAVTSLTVYPNPTNTSGMVTIECDDFNNVEIYTIDGRKVYSTTSNIFNVSDFTSSNGIYILVIQDNGFNTTNTRLLVQ